LFHLQGNVLLLTRAFIAGEGLKVAVANTFLERGSLLGASANVLRSGKKAPGHLSDNPRENGIVNQGKSGSGGLSMYQRGKLSFA